MRGTTTRTKANVWQSDVLRNAAAAHIHLTLRHMGDRIESFLTASPQVRRQVLAELDMRAEENEAGARTPAATTLVVVVGTGVTVISALLIAVVSGYFTTLAPLVDPKTGTLHGVTTAAISGLLRSFSSTVYWIAGIAVGVAIAAWAFARLQDRTRAASKTWASVYRQALDDLGVARGARSHRQLSALRGRSRQRIRR